MGYVRLTLIFLLLLFAVLFILSNPGEVQLSLSLVPYKTPHIHLWLVVLGAMLVGFFAGVLSRLPSGYMLRRRLRRAEKEIEILKAQLLTASQQVTMAREPAPPPAILPPADTQPPPNA